MANAYSILHNYDQPVYEPNLDLVTKVLSYKQQKLNTGRQKLQSLYDEFSMLDIIKPVDQEYAEERLSQVKNMVDKYASGDLSSDALVRDISSNMDNFVDDNVINAVVSTKGLKSDLSTWSQVREEEPEKFGEQNYRYAMEKTKAYTDNDKIGQKYNGEASFIEYVDVNKLMHENAQELSKTLKANYVENVNGKYEFRETVTGKRVDRSKMESALRSLIGPKVGNQLKINGWDTYNNLSDEQLLEQYTQHYSIKAEAEKGKISSLETALKSDRYTGEQKEKIRQEVDRLTTEVNKIENGTKAQEAMEYGREVVMGDLYTDRLMGRMLDTYEFDEVLSREVNAADKYFMDMQLEHTKINARLAKQAAESATATFDTNAVEGETVVVEDFTDTAPGNMKYVQNRKAETLGNVKGALSEMGLSSDVQNAFLDKMMYDGFNVIGKDFVEVELADGTSTRVKVTDNLTRNLIEYKQVLEKTTPYDKEIDNSISEATTALKGQLNLALNEANWNARGGADYKDFVPKLRGHYTGNPEDGYTFTELPRAAAEEVMLKIFNTPESDLTDREKLTKDMYIQTSFALDPDLSKEKREEAIDRVLKRARDNRTTAPIIGFHGDNYSAAMGATMDLTINEDGSINAEEGILEDLWALSDIGKGRWQVNTGESFSDTYVSSTTPSDIIRGFSKTVDKKVDLLIKDDRMLPAPTTNTFPSKSPQAKALFSLAANQTEVGGRSIDKTQDPTLIPQYSAEEGRVTGYKIKYFVKSSGTKGMTAQETAEFKAETIAKEIPLTDTSAPLLNANVNGQKLSIGTVADFFGEGSVTANSANPKSQIVGDVFSTMRRELQGQVELMENQEDKVKIDQVFKDVTQGRIGFELVTESGEVAVSLKKGGKTIYTAMGLIPGNQLHSSTLSDPVYVATLQRKAVNHYIKNVVVANSSTVNTLAKNNREQFSASLIR